MRILQALCFIVGVSLCAALPKCPSPMLDLLDKATKTTMTCNTDAECDAAFKGYICVPGTGGKFCCGAEGDCNANFVAIIDGGDFKACAAPADCGGAPVDCQNTMCCSPAQPPPANCDLTVQVEVNGKCQPKVGVEAGPCVDNQQCPAGSGATCVDGGGNPATEATPGTCKCPAATPIFVLGKCMAEALVGDACLDTAQCTTGVCNTTSKKCECPANNIYDSTTKTCTACADTEVAINNVCEKKKNIGGTCPKGALQCPAGAICTGATIKLCLCPDGFQANSAKTGCIRCDAATGVIVSDQCYPKVPFGAACLATEQCNFAGGVCTGDTSLTCQCIAGSTWQNNVCQPCDGDRVVVSNVCYDMSKYGAACKVNQQCTSYSNGICTAGQCVCTAGSAYNGAGSCAACTATQVLVANQCMDKVANGAVCTYNEQCAYTNGACVKGVCGCNGTLQYSGTGCSVCDGVVQNNLCYPYASRGQACTVDAQCTKTAGTKCIGYVCECPTGTTFNSVSCTSITDPSPSSCATTEVLAGGKCRPKLNPNGYFCYYAEQCQGGSACKDYICTCPAAMPNVVNNVCSASSGSVTTAAVTTAATTASPLCTGNTVRINNQCIAKTSDGVCLNVNCLQIGEVGCTANYAPYKKCSYNAGQKNYFCCP